MLIFAYSSVCDEDASTISDINTVGVGLNRGGYRAHGSEEEKGSCRNLHGEGFRMMLLQSS